MSIRDAATSAVKRLPVPVRLTIVRDDVGGLRRLRLYGTLDPRTAPLLGAFLPPHCRVGSGPVILDLAGLQTLHPCGVATLRIASYRLRRAGSALLLTRPNEAVRRLLDRAGRAGRLTGGASWAFVE